MRSRETDFLNAQSTLDSISALTGSALAKGLKQGSLAFSWADARVIHDSPRKMDLKKTGANELLISQLAPYILNAKKTVDIVSPYFVPGDKATQALCKLSQDGVQVRILTNPLASNDVAAVHAAYGRYRPTLLRCGVRLFELDESLTIREAKMLPWLPGLSKSGLHAKLMIFDGQIMFVGSFNFDQRSLNINNEIGLLFREPAIAGAAAKRFEDNVHKIAFEVRLTRKGCRKKLQWAGGQGGPEVIMQKEPYATTMQKLTVGMVKWLPVLDSQL